MKSPSSIPAFRPGFAAFQRRAYAPFILKVDLDGDTDRDGTVEDADDDSGEDAWTLARGSLVPPRYGETLGTNSLNGLSQLVVQPPGISDPGGLTVRLKKTDDETKTYLAVLDTGGNVIDFDANGYYVLPSWPTNGMTFYAASEHTRRDISDKPKQFTVDLEILQGAQVLCSDRTLLTVTPAILPPECNDAEAIYAVDPTTAIAGITGLEALNTTGGDKKRWTQDQVKFTKAQCRTDANTEIFIVLGHEAEGNLGGVLRYDKGLPGLKWDVGGDGGNMMATPPLGTNAPFGKLLLGTKRQASKPQWEEQNIQPVALIDTTWLMVGHVDEALMCVTADKVLYADPWKAADLLHQQIASGAGSNTIWFGFDTGTARNHTVQSVAIATNSGGALKITTLPTPGLSNGTAMATVVFSNAVFTAGDVLRVDDEILKVYSTSGPTTIVTRAEAGRPAAAHSAGVAIYAYSGILQDNLPVGVVGQSVVEKMQVVTNQLRQALGAYQAQFISVPVIFRYLIDETTGNEGFVAVTANMVNCLKTSGGAVYYSDPGNATFRNDFTGQLSGAQALDVWDAYHCQQGEVHCATAAKRALSAQPAWWQQLSSWE